MWGAPDRGIRVDRVSVGITGLAMTEKGVSAPLHLLTLGLKHPALLPLAMTIGGDCLKTLGLWKWGQLREAHHWPTSCPSF